MLRERFVKNQLFSDVFEDFGPPRHSLSFIFARTTSPRSLLFRALSENGDFVKIVLPLWWEHNFGGPDPPQIDPESDSEQRRKKKRRKSLLALSPGACFRPWARFLSILASRPDPRIAKRPSLKSWIPTLGTNFFDFWLLVHSGVFWEGPRTNSAGSGCSPGPDFDRSLRYFFSGSARILSGRPRQILPDPARFPQTI